MTDHEFTLVLDRSPSDNEIEALYEAGLNDASLEHGPVESLAHFSRDADTLTDAVLSAVHQLEHTGFDVVAVQSQDTVTLKDIAERIGRSYESVRLLTTGERGPGAFPPALSSGGWSLYSWAQVADWLRNAGIVEADVSHYDRQIAIADHLVRARAMMRADADTADLARLVGA